MFCKLFLRVIPVAIFLSSCAVADLPGNITYINASEAIDRREYNDAYNLLSGLLDRGGYHDKASVQVMLADLYLKGLGTNKNTGKAISLLKEAANQRDDLTWASLAQYQLGYIYEGNGPQDVEKDLVEAANWYRKAQRLGNDTATSALRTLEEYPEVYVHLNPSEFTKPKSPPIGTLADAQTLLKTEPEQAFKIAKWHAQSGNGDAQMGMARAYFNGLGTEQDFQKSMGWLWLSSDSGNLDAIYSLSEQFRNGDHVPLDYKRMRNLLETAASNDHGESINQLGILALNPIEKGYSSDPEKALRLFNKAAALGSTNALTNLGDMYLKGAGVEQDTEKAKKLLSQAADQGNQFAAKLLEEADTTGGSVQVTERVIKETVIVEKQASVAPTAEIIFKNNSKSVFKVVVGDVQKEKGELKVMGGGSGSAVAVTQKIALTNCHVVEGMNVVMLKFGDEFGAARVIKRDEKQDVCTLKSLERELTPISKTRRYSDLRIGETVYAIGSPAGYENSLSQGVISGKRALRERQWIQTTAAISPGSSGGGLFDGEGRLIGITTFKSAGDSDEGLNFAAPAYDFFQDAQ